MQDNGRPHGTDDTTQNRGPAGGGAGDPQPSPPERRAAGTGAAAREYGRRMTELDSAGAREPGHAGNGQRAADKEPAAADDGAGKPRGVRSLAREHALTIGLAATSIGLLLGARTGGAAPGGEIAGTSEPMSPPEERAEEKGVTWDLPMAEHERVDFFVEFLMGRNHDKTRTWLERMGKYAPMIQNELRERGMPEDLIYLTMIESGLNPNAYSKAHAAGLWQFIQETGERYGLEVSTHVDERRDPIKSTAAALTYLQQLYDRFDSWYLSAAGYNTGENRVGRLMREQAGTERGSEEAYWDIWERLPRETRDYVPLMIAMGKIAKEPAKYGFHDLEYMEPLQFEEVVVPGGTKLSAVAKAAGVDSGVIEDLNPHFVKQQTPPSRLMAVRVPVGRQRQVAVALNGEAITVPVVAD